MAIVVDDLDVDVVVWDQPLEGETLFGGLGVERKKAKPTGSQRPELEINRRE